MIRIISKNILNKYKLMTGGNKVDIYQLPMSAGNIMIRRDRGNRGTLHSAELVLVELANELSRRGHEVTIFCNDVNSRDEFMYPILPQVQYYGLPEVKSANFTNRTKFKFVRNIIIWKWKIYNAIKQRLQNLLQFRNQNSNTPSNPPPHQTIKHLPD